MQPLKKKRARVPSITDTHAPGIKHKGFVFDPPGTITEGKATLPARKKIVVPKKNGLARVTTGPQALSKITGSWDPLGEQFDISEVIIGGRTPSPFGSTMGAHSTAWVAHVDAIRRHLVGTDLQSAIKAFVKLIESELNSPLLQLKEYIGEDHKEKLENASDALKTAGRTLINDSVAALTESTYNTALQHLRSTINTYLTYVNYLPMATVSGGDPSGHGEGVARGELNLFEAAASIKHENHGLIKDDETLETLDALTDKEIQIDGEKLTGLDTDLRKLLKNTITTKDTIRYKEEIRAILWQMFAAETPMIFFDTSPEATRTHERAELWAFAIQNFLRTIRLAYPYAYNFCEMSEAKLLKEDLSKPYLKKYFKEDIDTVIALLTGKAEFSGKFTLSASDQIGSSKLVHQAVGISDYSQGVTHLQTIILLTDTDKIGDINFQGRTKSPFSSTMGAHSTAWVVHLDAVSRQLMGKSLPDAHDQLKDMASEAFDNEALEYAGIINAKHQVALMASCNILKDELRRVNFSRQNVGDQQSMLEDLIVAYLNFINVIPLSTVESGGVPGGRTEGQRRKFLQNYERLGDKVFLKSEKNRKAEIITDYMMGMYDHKGIDSFEREPRSRPYNLRQNVIYDEDHFLEPSLNDFENEAEEKEEYALQNFVNTIAEAYPASYKNSNLLKRILKKYGVKVKDPVIYHNDRLKTQSKRRKKVIIPEYNDVSMSDDESSMSDD